MPEQRFGPRRSRAAKKPVVANPGPVFYHCNCCNAVVQKVKGGGESLPSCCLQEMEVLTPMSLDSIPPEIELDYKIVGSLNENAVQVYWNGWQKEYQPLWFYLSTFNGGYLQYISEKKRPPVVFPLAGEDAYAYCDKDPCVQCTFRCKRGFVLYGYFTGIGLVICPLDRMSGAYRQ